MRFYELEVVAVEAMLRMFLLFVGHHGVKSSPRLGFRHDPDMMCLLHPDIEALCFLLMVLYNCQSGHSHRGAQ